MGKPQKNQVLIKPPNIGADQLAFLKSQYLSLDLDEMAALYLNERDHRVATRRAIEIRADAILRAQRANATALVDLLTGKVDVATLTIRPIHNVPTCEEWLANHSNKALQEFDRETQQYEYEQAFPKAKAAAAEVEEVDLVESLKLLPALPDHPTPESLVGWWLVPPIAATLRHAKVETLGTLAAFTQMPGWWLKLSRVGTKTAGSIVDFLADHAATLDLHPAEVRCMRQEAHGNHRDSPLVTVTIAQGTSVVPYERLTISPELDGSEGLNRGKEVTDISAQNDLDAFNEVLKRHEKHPHTLRTYRKELERLLLWAVVERGKAMSSLNHTDAQDYVAFVQNPQPAARWIEAQRAPSSGTSVTESTVGRGSPAWRPFRGPLSPESTIHAIRVIHSAFNFLLQHGYLAKNVFHGLSRPDKSGKEQFAERHFAEPLWASVETILVSNRDTPQLRREALATLLAYSTGLRAAELASASTDGMTWQETSAGAAFFLTVIGKGNKKRQVFLPDWIIPLLQDHMIDRGLVVAQNASNGAIDFKSMGACALIGDIRRKIEPERGIAATSIYNIVCASLDRAADVIQERGDLSDANLLRSGSTHWLRHTFATHKSRRGVELSLIQEDLGHASIETTSLYRKTDLAERVAASLSAQRKPVGL